MNNEQIADTFRRWGYLRAEVDSLDRLPPFTHSELEEAIKQSEKNAPETEQIREAYCSKIGAEFMHMPYPDRCAWVAKRMEETREDIEQRFILKRVLESETFEKFLHTRYVGSKRFSLEGNASLIPLLDTILERASENGTEIVMLAMQHRGRLNVMHHISNTLAETIIAGFEDVDPKSMLGRDDVKYHKGATGIYHTRSDKKLFIDLAANPSHLEAISPVLLGRVFARQRRLRDTERNKVLGIIMHGDAAFAGQGIAAETLNYATMPGFEVGGVVHIIINNLIGFTTTPEALHSSRFASDVAKRIAIPIFHVNAESPDDVVHVGRMATDYRFEFKSDVLVDLIGYRRFGHNEQDDPTVTSPALYQQIKNRPQLFEMYAEEVGVAKEDVKQLQEGDIALLEEGLKKGRELKKQPAWLEVPNYWDPYVGGYHEESLEVPTAITKETIEDIARKITTLPEDFTIHPKVGRVVAQRLEMALGQKPITWGMAEALAFGSLLLEGIPVRLTGQDVCRGTFAHRHATLHDHNTSKEYIPLEHLSEDQAHFDLHNSVLSEAAAVGFEYGYTRDYPEALVCWEAQFGDFVNGAQIILDQFIVAGEDKWSLLSGLVLLLPHGFEGMGPEHSSARLERFLQSAAEDNIQVCNPSSAGQYFHLLRRQALRKWRKPLVVMSPKSLLRAPAASSPVQYLTEGKFQNIVVHQPGSTDIKRLLLCSGKITHELLAEKAKSEYTSTAIISVEQLYPLPEKDLLAAFKSFPNANSIVWVQEEPSNMGAQHYIRPHLERLAHDQKVTTVRRSESASPATGSAKAHALEQDALIKLAFANYD